jgi:RHS repeat-associated protein
MGTNGTITDTYMYDAFGNEISNWFGGSAPTPNNYLYCVQQWDPDLGLYYNRARYLNPNAGRFWTADSTEGDQEDPLALHKYLYAQDNPVMGSDPSGNDLEDVTLAAGIGAGLDATLATATLGAEASASGTAIAATATESAEVAVAGVEAAEEAEEGYKFIETAKTTLRQVGKTVKDIIEVAKKLKNLPKNSPIKVIPMPAEVIPDVCANITTAMTSPPWFSPFELERCSSRQAAENREKAIGTHAPAGVGLSLDEYPFASSVQGGLNARVAPVPFWQNCVQGGIIGACYKIEDIKPGTPYTVVVIPR